MVAVISGECQLVLMGSRYAQPGCALSDSRAQLGSHRHQRTMYGLLVTTAYQLSCRITHTTLPCTSTFSAG